MRAISQALLSGCVVLCLALGAGAATNTIAYYRLGEDDPGAGPSTLGQDPTRDHSPNKLDLNRFGSPHYSSNVAPGAAAVTGSIVAMQFSPQTLDAYYRLNPVTTLTDNVGIEAWVNTTTDPTGAGQSVIAYDGTPGADGLGLLRVADATPFGGISPVYVARMGATTVGFSALPSGQWVHLALVRDGGTATFYVNGQPSGTSSAALSAATETFSVGASYCAVCDRPIPTADYLDGRVDEVRVFSFAPGQFNAASDLLYSSVPEPAALVMWCGLLPALLRRRGNRALL